ncbi:ABC transporter substrate-binding protein [Mycolicibacterium thermoresistibile]
MHISRRRLLGGVLTAAATVPLLGTACARTEPQRTGAGITVTDLTGQRIQLPHTARRIVTIPIPAASMIVAVNGGPEVLVGMNAASATAIDGSFLGQAYPELLDVPTDIAGAEFAPNVESVLNVEPDVVIQWGDRGPGITDPLRNAGLTVVGLTYGTQPDLEGAIALYGELLGKQQRAQTILDWMADTQQQLRAELPATGRHATSVLYLRGASEAMDAGAGASYRQFLIDVVGARNPAGDIDADEVTIDNEQLLAWDPDIILLGNWGPVTPGDMYADPALSTLQAVRGRRIYKVPLGGYRWDPPSQESPLMWQWLAGVVHDTGAPGLRAEVVRRYGFLYGTEPTAAQLDEILHTEANAGSHGYGDFGN